MLYSGDAGCVFGVSSWTGHADWPNNPGPPAIKGQAYSQPVYVSAGGVAVIPRNAVFSCTGPPGWVAVEGLLKVPATPFVFGMSANIGKNLSDAVNGCRSAPKCTPNGGASIVKVLKDDLWFFIGAKFDIGRVLGKLQQL